MEIAFWCVNMIQKPNQSRTDSDAQRTDMLMIRFEITIVWCSGYQKWLKTKEKKNTNYFTPFGPSLIESIEMAHINNRYHKSNKMKIENNTVERSHTTRKQKANKYFHQFYFIQINKMIFNPDKHVFWLTSSSVQS